MNFLVLHSSASKKSVDYDTVHRYVNETQAANRPPVSISSSSEGREQTKVSHRSVFRLATKTDGRPDKLKQKVIKHAEYNVLCCADPQGISSEGQREEGLDSGARDTPDETRSARQTPSVHTFDSSSFSASPSKLLISEMPE